MRFSWKAWSWCSLLLLPACLPEPHYDLDQDGYAHDAGDCDDNTAEINPGAVEICDGGIDNDCNDAADDGDSGTVASSRTVYYQDRDEDGFGDAGTTYQGCTAPAADPAPWVLTGGDCADLSPGVNPDADERCDGIDNDCDDDIDEGFDQDADGVPDCSAPVEVCDGVDNDGDEAIDEGFDQDGDGFTGSGCECLEPGRTCGTDCDDEDSDIHPDALEACDEADNDCDDKVDDADTDEVPEGAATWYPDLDADGYGASSPLDACLPPPQHVQVSGDCDDGNAESYPGAIEQCDNRDNDCDSRVDDDVVYRTLYLDEDGDGYGGTAGSKTDCELEAGYSLTQDDCDDDEPSTHPGAEERCDQADNDCDEVIDEGVTGASTWYIDQDSDGYGTEATTQQACERPSGYASVDGDCDDADPAVNPGELEVCDGEGIDEDCDGRGDGGDPDVDETSTWYLDADQDGFGGPLTLAACTDPSSGTKHYTLTGGDCDDSSNTINPDALEVCDSANLDEDCNGLADNDDPDVSPNSMNAFYQDLDGDGVGTKAGGVEACDPPEGFAADSGDCDDEDPDVHAGAEDIIGDLEDFDCDEAQDIALHFAGVNPPVGDGGPASQGLLTSMPGMLFDSSGNLYLVDRGHNRIRRISSTGVITTVAGSGSSGGSGDGGEATKASLKLPEAIALAPDGTLYIADTGNHKIRKVNTSGIISLAAGSGTTGFGGDGGQATFAKIDTPGGVAVDSSNNLYIADTGNNRIRVVSSSGVITTFAGTGTAGFGGDGGAATLAQLYKPLRITLDGAGNLFIVDQKNFRVRKVAASSRIITTVAGNGTAGYTGDGGLATAATFREPAGVYVDSGSQIYISDSASHVVRRVDNAGKISTVAGSGTEGFGGDGGKSTQALLDTPEAVLLDGSGNLYIGDSGNQRVRRAAAGGTISTFAGNPTGYGGDGGPATMAWLNTPGGVAVDTSGVVFIADTANHRIRRVSLAGVITTIAGTGVAGNGPTGITALESALNGPTEVALDGVGNLFVVDTQNHLIRKIDAQGKVTNVAGTGQSGFSGDGGAATQAGLSAPTDVLLGPAGGIFISDAGNNRIRRIDSAGKIATIVGNGVKGFSGDGGLATQAQLSNPLRLAMDSIGNLYIADSGNNRVRKVATDARISTVAGTGTRGSTGDGLQATSATLANPSGVAVDAVGNLFIADRDNHKVRRIGLDGIITTVVGTGAAGASAGGNTARATLIAGPTGLQFDSHGELYIVETGNDRVLLIDP